MQEVFVIDETGTPLGILSTPVAIENAKSKDLDLILVSPNANPPVAKILSWSKFKYQQEKRKKDNKGKALQQKEVWFNTFIGQGDLDHKIAMVLEFLQRKHSVKLTIRAKGRVTYLQEKQILDRIIGILGDNIEEIEESPKHEGRHITLIVRPSKNKKIINEKGENHENENKDSQGNSQKV